MLGSAVKVTIDLLLPQMLATAVDVAALWGQWQVLEALLPLCEGGELVEEGTGITPLHFAALAPPTSVPGGHKAATVQLLASRKGAVKAKDWVSGGG
jgi:hypothetical protein